VAQETTAGPRARYREQVRAEVKERAWVQIAEAGASALSLKAIAKQLGITAPALYRYFASRDDLLTELILSAYRDLAEVTETAAAANAGPAPARLTAIAQAIRAWALANSHRYLLIYGTPVPGYAAPPEATELARRILAPILDGFSAVVSPDGAGPDSANPGGANPGGVGSDGVGSVGVGSVGVGSAGVGWGEPDPVLRRSLIFWTRLHGVVSLEVAGHFTGMPFDPALLYAEEVASTLAGFTRPGSRPAESGTAG